VSGGCAGGVSRGIGVADGIFERSPLPFALGRPGFCGSGGRLKPGPAFDATDGSSPTRGTGLPGGRTRDALAAGSTIAALPAEGFPAASTLAFGLVEVVEPFEPMGPAEPVDPVEPVELVAAASFDGVTSEGSVDVFAGGSAGSTMIGASDPRRACGGWAAPGSVDAAADAVPAGALATAVPRVENCQAASAATATNRPPPAITTHAFDVPRRTLGAAWAVAASAAGADIEDARAAGRLGAPEPVGGSG